MPDKSLLNEVKLQTVEVILFGKTYNLELRISRYWGSMHSIGNLSVTAFDGEDLMGTLSINPTMSVPDPHFYVKDWSENEQFAKQVLSKQTVFVQSNLPEYRSGHIVSRAWSLKDPAILNLLITRDRT